MRTKITLFPIPISVVTCKFVQLRFLVLTLCALCVLCGEIPAQDFKQTHPGVEHAQVEHKIGEDPVKINLLRLDRSNVKLDVIHAGDRAIGLEETSSIARRRNSVAAINAGFFRLDKSVYAGDASGVLMIDQVLLSESTNDRTALFISDVPITNIGFGVVTTEHHIEFGGHTVRVQGINRELQGNDLVVYEKEFGPASIEGSYAIGITILDGKVAAVNRSGKSIATPAKGYFIAATGKFADELASLQIGEPVKYTRGPFLFRDGRRWPLVFVDDIVGGVPQLIKNGRIDITWEQEKASRAFVFNRHPRTAVAKMKDGKFLMVTVDGRQPGVSVGMTLPELAEYLLSLGAVDAMNLDGGGSTTMVLDGKVVNKPSDPNGERKIGDAIVVTLRKKK